METIKWYSPEVKKPYDNQVVEFKPTAEMDEQDVTYEGLYIESDDLFFIGFAERGDFIHSPFVAFWRPIDKEGIDPVRAF